MGSVLRLILDLGFWLSILVDVLYLTESVSLCFYSWDEPACWFWQKVDTPKSVDSGSFQLMIQFL
jgi:hypothetical protein